MIRNLLFDFGQVLYAIDPARSAAEFTRLFPEKAAEWRDILHHPVFLQLETGNICPAEFYETLRRIGGRKVSDTQIRDAWNALLLGPQPGRADTLAQLGIDYRLGLLSNTNQIHFDHFFIEAEQILSNFQYRFLSHELGLRKPDGSIYRRVLDVTGWNAAETIFIDDVTENLEGARELGFQTLHYTGESYLDSLQILLQQQ